MECTMLSKVEPGSREIFKRPYPHRISLSETATEQKRKSSQAPWIRQMQHDRSLSPSVRYQILDVYRNDERLSRKRPRANHWVNDFQNDPNLSTAVRRNISRIYSEDQKFRRRKLLTISQSKT